MTPREFSNMVKGYGERIEHESRERWEQARMVAYYSVAAHVKKGKSMLQVIPLPWDTDPAKNKEKLSDEQVANILRKFEKTFPGWRTRSAHS